MRQPMNPFKELGPRRFGFYFLLGYNSHIKLCNFIKQHKDIITALEVGCGYFDYYSHFCKGMNIKYTGTDIDTNIIAYRKSLNPEQDFYVADFENFKSPHKYDLVFANMTLEQANDVSAFLTSIICASRKYVYLVVWTIRKVNMDDVKNVLNKYNCKNIDIFDVPTDLPPGEPNKEIVISFEV